MGMGNFEGKRAAVSCAKMAEPIDLPFGLRTLLELKETSIRIRQVVPMCPHRRAYWRHLANTISPSVCGSNAALSNYVDHLLLLLSSCLYTSDSRFVNPVDFNNATLQQLQRFNSCQSFSLIVLFISVTAVVEIVRLTSSVWSLINIITGHLASKKTLNDNTTVVSLVTVTESHSLKVQQVTVYI